MSLTKSKKPVTFFLQCPADVPRLVVYLQGQEPTSKNPLTVKVSTKKEDRTSKQNRLSFLWYKELGLATGHGKEYERSTCKLSHGIPVLREDEEFNKFYSSAIDSLDYESKLAAMEFIPVTSLMNTKQFAEYLNTVDTGAAARGIVLSQPDDLYWQALMKESERRGE